MELGPLLTMQCISAISVGAVGIATVFHPTSIVRVTIVIQSRCCRGNGSGRGH